MDMISAIKLSRKSAPKSQGVIVPDKNVKLLKLTLFPKFAPNYKKSAE